MKQLMPDGSRCFFFSASVQANTMKLSATSPSEIHIFSPFRTQRSPLLDGGGLNAAGIAAGGRLGQAVGRQLLALRLRHQVLLLLLLGAPGEQRQAVEARVHRHDHAQRRVDVFELLAGDAERE